MFRELHEWDLIGKIAPILHPNGHFIIDPETHMIKVPEPVITTEWNTPWVHVRQDNYRYCKLYHDVFVQCLDFIPEKCINCWKVVFRPQYIRDMFNVMRIMYQLADRFNFACKLGMERREYTSGLYGKMGLWGCYFYNDSQKAGIHCWEKVKDAIAADDTTKHLLDDVDEDGYPTRLVLKRGCTEFEIGKFGDSRGWLYTEDNAKWEKIIWEKFERQDMSKPQMQEVQQHVMCEWFKHAHHAGDPTIKELNEGDMIWKSTRYYHKKLYDSVLKKRNLKKQLKKEAAK